LKTDTTYNFINKEAKKPKRLVFPLTPHRVENYFKRQEMVELF
jgi:hypothetical protein